MVGAVADTSLAEGMGAGAKLQPEEFTLSSGSKAGATSLAVIWVPEAIVNKEVCYSAHSWRTFGRRIRETAYQGTLVPITGDNAMDTASGALIASLLRKSWQRKC